MFASPFGLSRSPEATNELSSRVRQEREAVQFNMFDWIREGVKRSVILGVSDAMESIGSPEGDDARARLAQLLPVSAEAAEPALAGSAKRKRLGRSLRDIDGE
jgi:hypothetical protein